MKISLKRLSHPAFQLTSLVLLSIVLYVHTLDVPFYLDDYSSLVENPVIYMQQGTAALWQYSPLRFLPYLTFSWNYVLHQFSPTGYHVVSIVLHALTGLAAWWLVRVLLRTPRLRNLTPAPFPEGEGLINTWLPWLTALLFIIHPLQTQAVTYIVQRPTLFAALFYLLAIACYVQGRLTPISKSFLSLIIAVKIGFSSILNDRKISRIGTSINFKLRSAWFVLAAILALAGFFSKQNAATLPAALLLVELLFFQATWRRFAVGLGLILGSVLLLWIVAALSFGFDPLAFNTFHALTREVDTLSRGQYFLTQMQVLWQYIGLLFWPLDLHLDRDVLPAHFNLTLLLALAGHLALIAFALWVGRRWPLLGLGILFYYLAHMIESSFLPIRDLMFEHRTYLPNFGAFLALSWVVLAAVNRVSMKLSLTAEASSPALSKKKKAQLAQDKHQTNTPPFLLGRLRQMAYVLGACALITLAALSWQRNQMWRDPVTLWSHNAKLTPQKDRPWGILGKHLVHAQRYQEALQMLQYAIALKQKQSGSVNPLDLINLVVALRQLNQDEQALRLINQVLASKALPPLLHSKLLVNKGNIHYARNNLDIAAHIYSQALEVDPNSLEARANLGNVYMSQGKLKGAEDLYRQVLSITPNNPQYQANYAIIRQALEAKEKQ